jgi:hypothetical protein
MILASNTRRDEMLYQSTTRIGRLTRRAFGFAAGLFAIMRKPHSDGVYLDGMRPSELEDLGLRRGDDGSYRFFK